jgi:cob(I)alamin adenosyltransferase
VVRLVERTTTKSRRRRCLLNRLSDLLWLLAALLELRAELTRACATTNTQGRAVARSVVEKVMIMNDE